MKKFISVLSAIAIIGSSMGIHVIDHDESCCGMSSEILSFAEILYSVDASCGSDEQDTCCENSSQSKHQCSLDSENHSQCCTHQVILLKEQFVIKQNSDLSKVLSAALPVFVQILPGDAKLADHSFVIIRPPPVKIPKHDPVFTSAFLC